MEYYVGIDLGGTNTKIGILDENFNILDKIEIKTYSSRGAEKTFIDIYENILLLCKNLKIDYEKEILGIGMGIPGPVENRSIVKIAANFSWGNNFNAKELLEKITSKKCFVENDVRNITVGEKFFGKAKKYKNAIVIPIGTGIAAGLILNDKLYLGQGSSGEFGHIILRDNDIKCGCGLTGCIETYCSATGIRRLAIKKLKEKPYGMLYDMYKDNIDKIDVKDVFETIYKDENSNDVINYFCDNLAYGISTLVNILNPEIIVLTGGVSKSGDVIIERLKKYLPKYCLKTSLNEVKIEKSELMNLAGIKGAAALIKYENEI